MVREAGTVVGARVGELVEAGAWEEQGRKQRHGQGYKEWRGRGRSTDVPLITLQPLSLHLL